MAGTNLAEWERLGGRVYDVDSLKTPHVVPIIESLGQSDVDVAIEVGGGSWPVTEMARLPWPKKISTAVVDIAISDSQSSWRCGIVSDIDALVDGDDPAAEAKLEGFLAERASIPRVVGADLIVYSEILNYVDYGKAMTWFDHYLRPGGYTLVVNMPNRGFRGLFSDDGVKDNTEVVDLVCGDLGHEVVDEHYPRGVRLDRGRSMMILLSQKPLQG